MTVDVGKPLCSCDDDNEGANVGVVSNDDDDPTSNHSDIVPRTLDGTTDNSSSAQAQQHDSSSSNPSSSETTSSSSFTTLLRHPLGSFVHRTKVLWSQLTVNEISGSVGDLGTLVPLTVAMARQRSIYLPPALFFAGLSNVITGYSWDVPMCVQPMKSIAAVAISDQLSAEQVTASGMWMGVFCVALGITQLIELVNIIVPLPVVSGLQVGVGLRLATTGLVMIADLPWVSQPDCILLALLVSLLCMYWLREKIPTTNDNETTTTTTTTTSSVIRRWWNRIFCIDDRGGQHPVGLSLFLLGVVFATVELCTTDNADGQYDLPLQIFGAPIATWALDTVTLQDWKVGLLEGAIPQLPLTTLNSVISVCCLAHSLYPEKRKQQQQQQQPTTSTRTTTAATTATTTATTTTDAVVSRREVCISVGLMNLVFCPFGSMPNCHGAGGLAAQHRLGARHGASVVFLGINKVFLAVFFGASALTILDAIPTSILGVMLAIAGQELSSTGLALLSSSSSTKLVLRKNTVICIVTAMVIVGLQATHYGAIAGWVTYMIYGDGGTDFVQWCRTTNFRQELWQWQQRQRQRLLVRCRWWRRRRRRRSIQEEEDRHEISPPCGCEVEPELSETSSSDHQLEDEEAGERG